MVAVSNPGDGVAELVKVRAILPEGLEHSSRGRVVELDVGRLAPTEVRNLPIVCTARGSGLQKCQAVATGDGGLSATDTLDLDVQHRTASAAGHELTSGANYRFTSNDVGG